MDVIYCTIAFTSFSSFFGIRIVKTSMECSPLVHAVSGVISFGEDVIAPTQLARGQPD